MMRNLSRAGHEEPRLNPGRPRSKAKYRHPPIVEKYREGKAKRTPARGVKENLKPRAHKMSRGWNLRRVFCRISLRVAVCCEAKGLKSRSRRETESE